ncbi:MAG: hypothetical protein JWM87_4059 [Candidatus Eremiobacteraeota bacterium]|nr:hypothetical protein [Candidatus Eremiobacteraeota bacterium]
MGKAEAEIFMPILMKAIEWAKRIAGPRRTSAAGPPVRSGYRQWSDYRLWEPVENDVDAKIRDACRRFAAADDSEREMRRDLARMNGYDDLMHFACRSAVFAMRGGGAAAVTDGLTAAAAVDPRYIDPRDVSPPIALLRFAAAEIGADFTALVREAGAIAEPDMRDAMAQFAQRAPNIHNYGYALTQTPSGPGFIGWRWYDKEYDPTRPLDRIAVAIADIIGEPPYETSNVGLQTDFLAVWLGGDDGAALERARLGIRAGASVSADLTKHQPSNFIFGTHMIHVMIVELREAADAETLFRIAEAKSKILDEPALLGIRDGCVFSLLVARSTVRGMAPIETPDSVRRFAPRIAEALRAQYPIG